ncbi:CopY/TcrY family copper transport repressor [Lactococcus termiticola]|uniref:CopY/TcrY family copper transport repressor n=1 Tax=Lactococcus termiticola TaxID=2169526 RepID=A0A2R5HH61_9LACT|nr:CopY/TcrY family copper transport repressor [Lactococcus termiticola]GBG97379.1 CopY/TcrY family copper transport repressor [Lactococcus termiticola]
MEVNISDAEMVVMRVVWSLGQATVADVEAQVASRHDWSLPTIKTLLGRLVKKEMLSTEKEGRRFIYQATLSECDAIRLMSQELLDKVCQTKQGQLLGDMIDQAKLSETDVELLIEQLKAKKTDNDISCSCLEDSKSCQCQHVLLAG